MYQCQQGKILFEALTKCISNNSEFLYDNSYFFKKIPNTIQKFNIIPSDLCCNDILNYLEKIYKYEEELLISLQKQGSKIKPFFIDDLFLVLLFIFMTMLLFYMYKVKENLYVHTKNYKNDNIKKYEGKLASNIIKHHKSDICSICYEKEKLNIYFHEIKSKNNKIIGCRFVSCKECFRKNENKCLYCDNMQFFYIPIPK